MQQRIGLQQRGTLPRAPGHRPHTSRGQKTSLRLSLTPRPDGLIETTQLEQAIQANTQLVSVMVANNEIGVIQPVQELSTICRNHGITMHTDAAQAYGHLSLNMQHLGCSLLSVSAHKFQRSQGNRGSGGTERDQS